MNSAPQKTKPVSILVFTALPFDADAMSALLQLGQVRHSSETSQVVRWMDERPFDAIIADAAAPGNREGELFRFAAEKSPGALRIALNGRHEPRTNLQIMDLAHQIHQIPLDIGAFIQSLRRSLSMRQLLNHDRLRLLIAQIHNLPTLPGLYLDFLDEMRKSNPSTDILAEIIRKDMGLCSKLLQLVNSAFFGLPHPVVLPEEALLYAGFDNVKSLMLSLQVFALFDQKQIREFNLEGLWDHSWSVGTLARDIARLEQADPAEVDAAFTAGLLHDIGKLVLATGLPKTCRCIHDLAGNESLSTWQAELQILQVSHAEVGASLLAAWGLPESIVDAVARHHEQPLCRDGRPNATQAVQAANHFINNPHQEEEAIGEMAGDFQWAARQIAGRNQDRQTSFPRQQ